MDLIIADESPSAISDQIKSILFAKSAEKIDMAKPHVASSIFDNFEDEDEEDDDAIGDEEYEEEGE